MDDPLQARAIDALEPFLALAPSATSPRAVCELVVQATSAPDTYVFAELLATPQVQSLRDTEHSPHLRLLEIFSWGTWSDYDAHTPALPPLAPAQLQKLRLLSLLTLCTSPSHQPSTYEFLLESLALPSNDELEALVREATYIGLISARLSPSTSLIHITSISPIRDLAPGTVPKMQAVLTDWEARCSSVLGELEAQVESIKRGAAERRRKDRVQKEALEKALSDSSATGKEKRKAASKAGGELDELMGSGGGAAGGEKSGWKKRVVFEEPPDAGHGTVDGADDDGEEGEGGDDAMDLEYVEAGGSSQKAGGDSPKGRRKSPRSRNARGGKAVKR